MKAQPWNAKRYFGRRLTSLRKHLGLEPRMFELDPELSRRELLVHAPPLSSELTQGIRLISPQFRLRAGSEHSRLFWERNQNGLCWSEYEAIAPVLDVMPRPSKVLDIGPGMGRSVVFFKKKMGWQDVPFHLYESNGEDTNYTKAGPRFDDSFCGNWDAMAEVLRHNEIEAIERFDASDLDAKLSNLPGPYDFIYSFYAIGFHWSLEHFLDEILGLAHERTIGVFTLHDRFDRFDTLSKVPYRVVPMKESWPRESFRRLLVLSPEEENLSPLPRHSSFG